MELCGKLVDCFCDNRVVRIYQPPQKFINKKLPTAWICAGDSFGNAMIEILPQLEKSFEKDCEPFYIASIMHTEWESDYTPWPAQAPWKSNELFTGKAGDFFAFLTQKAIPLAESNFSIGTDHAVLGYSLGGLAALWGSAQDKHFGRCGSISGSLWYDGFMDWLKNHAEEFRNKKVYFSLGRREEKVRNRQLRQIGDCTRNAVRLLKPFAGQITLQWNNGGHFNEPQQRILRALLWLFRKDRDRFKRIE